KQRQETVPLFESSSANPILPKLESSVLEDYYDEMELMGFVVSGSMFDLAKSDYRGDCRAAELVLKEGKVVRMVGDFVADKTVKTKRGGYMKFGTFLDEEGAFFDTVHFPPSLNQFPLRGKGLYLLEGKVVLDFGCPALEITRCGRMPLKPDPRSE